MSDDGKVINLGGVLGQYRAQIDNLQSIIRTLETQLEEANNKLAQMKGVNDLLTLQLLDLIKVQQQQKQAADIAIANLQKMLNALPK